jgi:hypothetical protein
MSIHKRLIYMVLGGFLALSLFIGAFAVFAQTGDGDTTEEDSTPEGNTDSAVPGGDYTVRGFSRGDDRELLADALGISVEELEAAYETAAAAAVQQAVDEGLITEEQAEDLLSRGRGFRRGFGFVHAAGSIDFDALLADALGISVEELQSARAEVQAARLAEMVEAGVITQEEADMMLARQAVQQYYNNEAVTEAVQAAYEAAVEQALQNGDITEAQAEVLLENLSNLGSFGSGGFFGRGRGFGGPGGGGGRHFHGGPAGEFFAPSIQIPMFDSAFGA